MGFHRPGDSPALIGGRGLKRLSGIERAAWLRGFARLNWRARIETRSRAEVSPATTGGFARLNWRARIETLMNRSRSRAEVSDSPALIGGRGLKLVPMAVALPTARDSPALIGGRGLKLVANPGDSVWTIGIRPP